MPGQPHLVQRHNKVQAREDRAESGNEDRHARRHHVCVDVVRRERCRECPASINSAAGHGVDHQEPPTTYRYQLKQVDLGQRQIFGPDHHGDEKIAQRGRNRRHQEQEDHDDAVHGEHLVIGVGRHQIALRRQQFQTNQSGERSADEEEERNRDQIKNCDPFMISGQQPAEQAVLLGQEVGLRNSGRGLIGKIQYCGAHGFTFPCGFGCCPAVVPVLSGSRSVVLVVCWMR